ncbi:sigma-54-dependent transcriptional regulator [Salmonella enterica]|nr:sigma-54-dependent transcriptional regulator [Salmonella enterica]
MRKDALLAFLMNQTDFFDPENVSEVFTARYLAQRFNMQRNTASHYLNQLVAQGVLCKINTRPVYFLHKQAFSQQFFTLSRNEYASVAELLAHGEQESAPDDHFSLLIGHNESLKRPIEQLKTALFYPDGGLPLLMTGESGTGKSYLAQLMHEYAIAQALLSPDAPFISFNCAQYASNPELLAANLFGYVKGAFTGAQSDRPGAFEAADGGMLFLDEVHRLSAEGQEKLFTWLDRGEIYRVGDTAQGHPVSVRLVFATTEEIHSTFLTTFLRRIPIQVNLPDLQHRSRQEKEALILLFFWTEAKKLSATLILKPRLLQILNQYVYRGNVGELKNVVKYAVATAWAKKPGQETVTVSLYELVRSGKEGWETVQKRMGDEIETLFDRLIFTGDDNVHSQRLLLITSQVREEFYRLEKRFNMQLNGNCIYALSHYLIHRTALAPSRLNSEQIRQLDAFLAQKYPLLYSFCLQILETLGQKLDLEPRRIDMLLLALWLHKQGANNQKQVTHAVILAHGYATASSIANVANRLLKNTIFESFDMPLDVTPEAIAQQVMRYLEEHPLASGLMILVDMGSLKAIHRHFDRALSTPVTIINNVSTSMALYVGERILQGHFIEEIARDIARDVPVEYQLYWPKSNKPRAILTTCATGIGVATNLCALLSASIPQALEIDVVACDYAMLASNKTQEPVFMRYDVLAIVGTLDPHIASVPWISLDSLISGEGNHYLMRLFGSLTTPEQVAEINNLLLKNFSLRRVIESVTILDTSKVINHVEQFLLRYEHLAGVTVSNERKVALYVHISCLIERLIRHAGITAWSGQQCPEQELNRLREAFSVIESNYSVKIPTAELGYIHNILTFETELIEQDQQF